MNPQRARGLTKKKKSFTQPLCDSCWLSIKGTWDEADDGEVVCTAYPLPLRVVGDPLEQCCICGRHTISGIYTRIDPDTVQYPTDPAEFGVHPEGTT